MINILFFYNFLPLKIELLTPCNLGHVRVTHINPHIFGKNMKRIFCFSVARNLKIQISNGQNFKILTVKNSNSCYAFVKNLNHVHILPKGPRTPYLVLPKLETIHIMVWDSLSSRKLRLDPDVDLVISGELNHPFISFQQRNMVPLQALIVPVCLSAGSAS